MNTHGRLLVAFLFAISMEQDHFTDGAEARNLDFLPPLSNKALKGHDIRTLDAVNEGNCMAECYFEERCVSYNLGPFVDGFHKCELKDADDRRHHKDLITNVGYLFRAAKNPCNEITCDSDLKTCLTGFTDKGYICKCKPGYRGEPCKDINECAESPNLCLDLSHGECQNTNGSYQCVCASGYQLKDGACSDTDECEEKKDDCSTNAMCQNTEGSFNCICNFGFRRHGGTCKKITMQGPFSKILEELPGESEVKKLSVYLLPVQESDKQWKRCFRASFTPNNYGSSEFHSKCDNKGPTVTLVRVNNAYVFGGYTNRSWNGQNGYFKPDPASFLFTLKNADNQQYKMPYKSPQKSPPTIFESFPSSMNDRGPTFSYDLSISDNCNNNMTSYSYLGYNYQTPDGYSYGSEEAKRLLAGSHKFRCENYEVFYTEPT